jgi:hypothetical protein
VASAATASNKPAGATIRLRLTPSAGPAGPSIQISKAAPTIAASTNPSYGRVLARIARPSASQSASPIRCCRSLPRDARQRAQQQRAAQRHDRRGPVAVHPVAEDAEAQDSEHRAEQRPLRRQPALQHPADRGAHQRRDQQLADPRMPEQLPGGQHQPLRGRVDRTNTSAGG